jgi:O-acetyl-ADP-ribose deacetylase (regulator of RNase III)
MPVQFMKPLLNVVLVDINAKVVEAWKAVFADAPEVRIHKCSITDQYVDAWVSPTNSLGSMDGGVDAVIKKRLGAITQTHVQAEIKRLYGGFMPVGSATCVPTGVNSPKFLISTPTMTQSVENVSETLNVAMACAAAFQTIHMQNKREPGSIESVALVGMGAATGRVPARVCANLMWTGYALFNDYEFRDFDHLRAVVQEHLGGVDAMPEIERVRVKLPEVVGPPDSLPWLTR